MQFLCPLTKSGLVTLLNISLFTHQEVALSFSVQGFLLGSSYIGLIYLVTCYIIEHSHLPPTPPWGWGCLTAPNLESPDWSLW